MAYWNPFVGGTGLDPSRENQLLAIINRALADATDSSPNAIGASTWNKLMDQYGLPQFHVDQSIRQRPGVGTPTPPNFLTYRSPYYDTQWKNVPGGTGVPNYYNPKDGTYGTSPLLGPDYAYSAVGQKYWDEQPKAAFTRWLSEKGVNNNTNFGKWANSQYGDLYSGFQAANGDNPEMRFYGTPTAYLTKQDLTKNWANMTSAQHGENMAQYAPRARYVPRGM